MTRLPNPITDGEPRPTDQGSIVERTARWASLIGVALCAAIGFGPAIPFGDLFLGMAAGLRVVQLLTTGLPLREFRRHDVLLVVIAAICLSGFVAGVVNNQTLSITYLQTVAACVGSLWVVGTYSSTDGGMRELIRAYALGGAFLGVMAFVLPFVEDRAISYSTHYNILGHTQMMVLAAAVACRDWSHHRRLRILWTGIAGLAVVTIYFSGSRGALAGAAVATLLYLGLSGRVRMVLAALAASWFVAIAVLLGAVQVPADSAVGRLLGDDSATYADRERAQAFDDVVELIEEKPILGDGFNGILLVHVVYLQFWSAGGAIAGAAVMGLGITMAAMPFMTPRTHLALRVGLAGLAVMWLFTNIAFARDQWIFMLVCFRLCLHPDVTPSREAPPSVGAARLTVASR